MATRCDTRTLAEVIERCFDLSMDLRLPEEERSGYLIEGKRLRGHLLNLVSARFKEGTRQLEAANQALSSVNDALASEAEAIANATRTLDGVGKLVGVLDQLLKIAASFV